ncbi:MAG TPA: peptidylprolyl isomerase [Solirubrobacteraceae bacterium]|nr:peptidylprolyl isomerase [Solirubrobacteraceae bacterium]
MSRLPVPIGLVLCCALALGACGGGDEQPGSNGKPAPEATATAKPAAEAGCEKAPEPESGTAKLAKPKLELDAKTTYVARVVTNCGEFEITLDAKRAPRTGGSFVTLVKEGFYDGLIFHRVVPGFVIQGGDPKGDGSGGPGYSVVEAPPEDLTYGKGVVAMAKTQTERAGTSGSQFFVVTGEDAGLPPEYALLGKVTKGEDVIDRIGVTQVGQDEKPVAPVVIRKIRIEES